MDPRKANAARSRRLAFQRQTPLKFKRTGPGVLDLGKTTYSGATSPVYGVSGLRDTSMDLGSGTGAVLFSVNPPSPLESDYYSDDQESILRTWHTDATSSSAGLGAVESCRDQEPVTFEPAAMDHGIKASQDARSTQSKSLKSTVSSLPTCSAETPGRGCKKSQGRRPSTGESNRKTELYKTEMCISVSSGVPCRYVYHSYAMMRRKFRISKVYRIVGLIRCIDMVIIVSSHTARRSLTTSTGTHVTRHSCAQVSRVKATASTTTAAHSSTILKKPELR